MENNLIQAVFGNPLIWNALGRYLSFQEFTDLRLVNRLFKDQVDDCEFFHGQCWKNVFMIPTYPETVFPQDDSSMICRNVKVVFVVSIPDEAKRRQQEFSSEVFSSMKGLKISQFIQTPRSPYHGASSLATPDSFQSAMATILNKMETLEIFSANILLMGKINMEHFSKISKIQKLVIFRPGTSSAGMVSSEVNTLTKNMILLSKKIENLKYIGFVENSIGMGSPIFSAISSTLEKNVGKVCFLEILQPEYWKMSSISKFKFPLLRTVKIRATHESRHIVEEFLENQPLLEHLKLSWKDYFPKSVYDLVSRKASKLRTLHVKGRSFGPEESRGNWEFLKELQYLEDIEIKCQQKYSYNRKHEEFGIYQNILEFLPPTIRRLHFRGLASNQMRISNSALFRFRSLQDIRLLRCRNVFDDSILQALLTNQDFCSRIKTFEFSHCDNVTNAGLISPYGHSINNMKELRRLTIKRCPSITDAVLNKLLLPYLKFLDISSNIKLQQQAIASAAVRCPKLEMLRSSWKMSRDIQNIVPSSRYIRLLFVNDSLGRQDEDSGSD